MKKTLGVLALTGAGVLAFAPSASAAECGTPAVDAVYKTVVTPATPDVFKSVKVVDVEAVPGVPAVTEQVKVVDVEAKPATPGSPAVEEVSHIEHRLVTPAQPAVEEVSHFETKVVKEAYDEKVVDKAAYDETIVGQWWNWSPNHQQGPFDGPPAFPTDPRGTWQGPHTNGGPDQDLTGTFNVSNENSGNASWFHRAEPTVVHHPEESHLVHHDAVTEQVKVIDVEAKDAVPAVYEDVKVIDVEAKDAVPATPAVEEESHLETRVVTPAIPAVEEVFHFVDVLVKEGTPASKKSVLVSEAFPATEDCAVPSAARRSTPPPTSLAFTGSNTAAGVGTALLLMTAGGIAITVARRKTA